MGLSDGRRIGSGRASRNGVGAGLNQSQRDVLAWLAASAAMMLALIFAGAVERLSADLPRYRRLSDRPMQGTLGMGRSAFYGLFLDGVCRLVVLA